MVAHLTQVTEHERGFLQQRVALFGKVMFGIMLLGSVSPIPLVMIVPMIIGGMGLTDPPSPTLGPHFLTALQLYQVLVMVVLLTHCFVVRAALVPSPPRYTAAITAAAGVPLTLITATGVPGLRLERLIAANAAPGAALQAAAVAGLWWMFTVIVCTVISRVIYGLRLEVREARQLGQYTLEQKLGEGGMGIVYRARHAMMRRPTAVKLLPPNRAGGATMVGRARRRPAPRRLADRWQQHPHAGRGSAAIAPRVELEPPHHSVPYSAQRPRSSAPMASPRQALRPGSNAAVWCCAVVLLATGCSLLAPSDDELMGGTPRDAGAGATGGQGAAGGADGGQGGDGASAGSGGAGGAGGAGGEAGGQGGSGGA